MGGKKKKRGRKAAETANAQAKKNNQQPRSKEEELEFEDPFEDQFEENEDIVQPGQASMQDEDDEDELPPAKVWQPGMEDGEETQGLDYDSSAYTTFHRMNVDWPCLSVDILLDSLGHFRTKFPQTIYLAAGTQASSVEQNKVMLLKVSSLHKTKHDGADSDDDESDDDDDLDDDPILEERNFKHPGGVNRIRSMPQSPNMLATWADSGQVHIWDTQHLLKALDKPPLARLPEMKPCFSYGGHAQEGFAMDWSPVKAGRLVTGDCSKHIYLWDPVQGGGWAVDKVPFNGHSDSVEDVQCSPNEENVFASCSVDKTIRIWDARERSRSMLFVAAHQADVNVISWNKKVSHLLCSGADDGIVKIWDLRNFKSNSPAANFKWHKAPITSVQWHPTDESILAVASADHSISTWDMALEDDPEAKAAGAELSKDVELPPQLLFIHQGQKDIKELRFHPQVPSLIVSTAADGLNIFKPSNMN